MKRLSLFLFPLSLCVGCAGGSEWMPLRIGTEWTYRVRTTHYTYVEPVKVVRKAPVGDQMGFVTQSELGESRLAWISGTIVAETLGHSHFVPPIPLCLDGEAEASTAWKGLIVINGKSVKAHASLICKPESMRWKGVNHSSRRADLVVEFGGSKIEWTSWFVSGEGIVRQEQRTNGELDVSLEMINGT